jgi:NAD(P)-dependent dehydrogenase (short-subunit alcohol dehydrogenase family)
MTAHEGGVILNASSSDAIAAEPGMGPYAAAKAALLALTRAMAFELGPHRIRVCAVLPGETATHPWPDVELQRIYESRIAIGRSGRPDEIAAAYLYLASEDARSLNGVAAVVDGGMLAWE